MTAAPDLDAAHGVQVRLDLASGDRWQATFAGLGEVAIRAT